MRAYSRARLLAVAGLALFGLSGCLEAPKPNVRPGVAFHLVGEPGCPGCKQLPGPASDGVEPPTFFLHPAYIRDRDIEFVALLSDDASTIGFEFTPSAAKRILRVSTENQGKQAALVANGRILMVATIAGPYSENLSLSGLPAEQRGIYDAITIPRE